MTISSSKKIDVVITVIQLMNKACPTGEELRQLDRSLDIQPKKRGGQEKIPIWEDKEEVDK
ncbi:hypothetical protein FT637_11505 [Bacillus cereus]|uniref:hypothetical protein n=1 Tax=Bacillus cereus TaxID=1396 RepID=UPI00187AEC8E|nr:hypothetical protein [Bacillus cereus]MBE7103651.1 hypothetical protein [Bacillus cereus]